MVLAVEPQVPSAFLRIQIPTGPVLEQTKTRRLQQEFALFRKQMPSLAIDQAILRLSCLTSSRQRKQIAMLPFKGAFQEQEWIAESELVAESVAELLAAIVIRPIHRLGEPV